MIIKDQEAQDKIKSGIYQCIDAVKVTLGPWGKNVALFKEDGVPIITNDGVSIVKHIKSEDPFEQMGISIAQEVADNTNSIGGDGTTTSMVLLDHFLNTDLEGLTATEGKKKMIDSAETTCGLLQEKAKPIESIEDLKKVAFVSSEDKEIADTIAEVLHKIGTSGVVSASESNKTGIECEYVNGMQMYSGYVSPYMATDREKMVAVHDNIHVLVTDHKIKNLESVITVIDGLAKQDIRNLVIVCEDIDQQPLANLVLNSVKGKFNALVIKAPSIGKHRSDILQDLCMKTGAKFCSKDLGDKLEDITLDHLGDIENIESHQDKTIIRTPETINVAPYVDTLKKQEQDSFIKERIANLEGKIAIIRVGAATQTEMNYLKLKIEDTINAVRCAMDDGVVQGGGIALREVGIDCVHRQICENAEVTELEVSEDIIEPVKVLCAGIRNAASAAATLITTKVAIAYPPKNTESVI